MHTEENTNIDIIEQKGEKYGDSDNNCVLLITGSLNPIHRSHIKNLQLVKTYLEQCPSPGLNVLAGYLSPTHDSYVHRKLGNRHWISGEDRCDLCEKAIEDEHAQSWLAVSKGESRWKDGFVDFDDVSKNLAKFLNSKLCGPNKSFRHPIKVIYVCGLDHFNTCPHVALLSKEKNVACAVIYRSLASEYRIKNLAENWSNVYYISLDDQRSTLIDISSTKIREQYENSMTTVNDEFSYPHVKEFLQKKYKKNDDIF